MEFLKQHLRIVDKGVDFHFYRYNKNFDSFTYEGTVIPNSVGVLGAMIELKKEIPDGDTLWLPITKGNDGELVGVLHIINISKLRKGRLDIIRSFLPFIGVYMDLKQNCQKIDETFMNTIMVLSDAIDTRDYITSGHSKRVADYSKNVGMLMGMSLEELKVLSLSAAVHDIGKIGIPESILFKPGRLNTYEFDLIKTHTTIGFNILSKIHLYDEFKKIPTIVRGHHERINGSGYPDGLVGDEILPESKIIAVCDVFDALTNTRPYRDEMSFNMAKELLEDDAELFDRNALDNFFKIPDDILKSIYSSYRI